MTLFAVVVLLTVLCFFGRYVSQFVVNVLQWLEALLCTAEFTVERNRTNVMYVTGRLLSLEN